MPRPTRLRLPTAMTSAAAVHDAWREADGEEGQRSTPGSRASGWWHGPRRRPTCRSGARRRDTGVMKVCSMVPSQRSHMITRLMSSSTADRYAHVSVPISRNSMSLGTSTGLDQAAAAGLLGDEGDGQGVDHPVDEPDRPPTPSSASTGSSGARRTPTRGPPVAGAGDADQRPLPSSVALIGRLLVLVVFDAAAGEGHEHRLHVDVLDATLGAGHLRSGARAGVPSATIRPPARKAMPVAEQVGLLHVVGGEQDRHAVVAPDLGDEALHVALASRVQPGGGLVEQHQPGRGRERRGRPPPSAAGRATGAASAPGCDPPRDRGGRGSPRCGAAPPAPTARRRARRTAGSRAATWPGRTRGPPTPG